MKRAMIQMCANYGERFLGTLTYVGEKFTGDFVFADKTGRKYRIATDDVISGRHPVPVK